jgi:TadE-like protein.
MAEFALIVPILLVLFVAIADFGRIFAAGVAVEAATRDAAEATANEYLAKPPEPLNSPAPSGNQPYYDSLHTYAAKVVCSELRALPSTTYDPATQTCRDPAGIGPDMPLVVVCIHDGADAGCGAPASPGGGGIPASCGDFTPAATSSQNGTRQRWVEVRTCYHFTNILQMTLFSFGDVWLQRSRNFTIPCYFVLGTDECG